MAPAKKLNILVYTGAGTTGDSVRHCMYSLGRLLSPNYAVRPVTETILLKEPWASTCKLLVMPGGADLSYCRVLNGAGNRLIEQYMRRGGAYLGFCAGGYYGSGRCEFEVGNGPMEVVGSRELAFFPGTCRGAAFPGFRYQSEHGARAAALAVCKPSFSGAGVLPDEFRCYYNGGGVFVDADKMVDRGVEVLAEYVEPLAVESGARKAAVVYCKVGQGGAVLTGPHPEFAAVNIYPRPGDRDYDDVIKAIREDDEARTIFLKGCLTKLGLEVVDETTTAPCLSTLHLSSLMNSHVSTLLHSLGGIVTKGKGGEYIKGENDLFHLEKADSKWSMEEMDEALAGEYVTQKAASPRSTSDVVAEHRAVTKRILGHDQEWPSSKETPFFNHSLYFSSLEEYREKEAKAETWGDVLLYGQVVTSTNTLLERNPSLLAKLPTGFTFAATTQVAGRGRGSNVWVSPTGSLIMSTVINHVSHPARPIVFLQYLAAVAVVEAVQTYGDDGAYASLPVKLKWPNDIYAQDPTAVKPSYVKIGGILANCAYSAGHYQVVLGIGINTTNSRPTTSLDALLGLLNERPPPFRIERLLARILTRFEGLYATFCRDGFTAELEARYYAHWLHTGQLVTLEAEGGVRARVLGITREWGLLRAEEVRDDGAPTGRVWALQSDENSFDFWKGLVKRKL